MRIPQESDRDRHGVTSIDILPTSSTTQLISNELYIAYILLWKCYISPEY